MMKYGCYLQTRKTKSYMTKSTAILQTCDNNFVVVVVLLHNKKVIISNHLSFVAKFFCLRKKQL